VLSDNAIDHALLMLGALHVGVPIAPISPAYPVSDQRLSLPFSRPRFAAI